MLIAVCTDDQMVEDICADAANANPAAIGASWYRVYAKAIPDLGLSRCP